MDDLKKHLSVFLLGCIILMGCKEANNKEKTSEASSEQSEETTGHSATAISAEQSATTAAIFGDYVSADYAKKNEGYDWVAVSVVDLGDNKARIKVRSRADKKKPTCTFDAVANKSDETTYRSMVNGKAIRYTFAGDELTIAPDDSVAQGVLAFYCSGGATVSGTYTKIDGAIDASQVDQTLYSNVLMLQGIGFNISAVKNDGKNELTVTPFGLEIDNNPVTLEIEGGVVNAEIEDLNSDGSPEVLIYTQTADSNKYGDVYGFSTNNKKSMSQVYFPPISENDELSQGYQGHDEFAIVETSFAQRFPIFDGSNKTGKMRQIIYKLVDGEAMRSFTVDQVNEF